MRSKSSKWLRRLSPVSLITVAAVGLTVAGCGSSSSSSSSADSSNSSASTGSASGSSAAPGIEQAKAQAATLGQIPGQPLIIPRLTKKPPAGLPVAYVSCTLPVCEQNAGNLAAQELGMHLTVVPFDITKGPADLIRAFQQALTQGAKYIVYGAAFAPNAMGSALTEAKQKGVKLAAIAYLEPPGANNPNTLNLDGPKPYEELGFDAATEAIADAGTPTNIVVVAAEQQPAWNIFVPDGVQQAVAKYSPTTKVQRLGYSLADPQTQTVASEVNFIRRNPDVRYAIAADASAFIGLPQALAQAGLAGKVKLIAIDAQGPEVKEIADGQLFAGVASEDNALMYRAIDGFARLATGQPLGNLAYPDQWTRIITKTNASQVNGLNAEPGGAPVPYNYNAVYQKAWGNG